MADSLGFFDGEKGTFRKDAITAAGIFMEILPEVTGRLAVLGEYRGIPVTAALGEFLPDTFHKSPPPDSFRRALADFPARPARYKGG